ncbi:RNA polymerase subunit sigma-70 [Pendulispora rubella]|uniref:RNA polymerase subunit sigma-70 n=1 Tax=Pendulispora rubella TaxID=2741070 RepID=A0ABZ2L6X3_9BACT
MQSRLVECLFRHTSAELAGSLRGTANLESTLDALVGRARRAWPDIEVDDEAFLAHVARHLETVAREEAAPALEQLFAEDLFLALACAQGQPKALAHFDRTHLRAAAVHVRCSKMSHVDTSEVEQRLREKLFMADPGAVPKIAMYAGRGPLGAWVRVAATRIALSMQRSAAAKRVTTDAEALLDFAAADDPELEHLRATYADAFRAAFQDALLALAPEDRTLLRLSVVDRLTGDAIARVFGIHRATVVRKLTAARDALFHGMRRLLGERLRLDESEFESLVGNLMSQFDMSIQRVLAETASTDSH